MSKPVELGMFRRKDDMNYGARVVLTGDSREKGALTLTQGPNVVKLDLDQFRRLEYLLPHLMKSWENAGKSAADLDREAMEKWAAENPDYKLAGVTR